MIYTIIISLIWGWVYVTHLQVKKTRLIHRRRYYDETEEYWVPYNCPLWHLILILLTCIIPVINICVCIASAITLPVNEDIRLSFSGSVVDFLNKPMLHTPSTEQDGSSKSSDSDSDSNKGGFND